MEHRLISQLIMKKIEIEKEKNNMNLHELPIKFMTKEEAERWLDNDE